MNELYYALGPFWLIALLSIAGGCLLSIIPIWLCNRHYKKSELELHPGAIIFPEPIGNIVILKGSRPEGIESAKIIPYSQWETCLELFKQERMELEDFVERFSGCVIEPKPKPLTEEEKAWHAAQDQPRYHKGAGSYIFFQATPVVSWRDGFGSIQFTSFL